LAGVERARGDGGADRGVEIGRGHDHEGVAAAELEDGLLEVLAGGARDGDPGRLAAGERDGGDALVGDHARDAARADEQRLEGAVVEAGAREQLLEGERAARDVGGVLEERDVAGDERGRGEAEHLPEGEVPRHDREHRAERQPAHEGGPRAVGGEALVGEVRGGVRGVMAAGARALVDLGQRGAERLAHLLDDGAGQRDPLGLEEPRRLVEPRRAFVDRAPARHHRRARRRRQLPLDAGVVELVEARDLLPGGRVHARDHLSHAPDGRSPPPPSQWYPPSHEVREEMGERQNDAGRKGAGGQEGGTGGGTNVLAPQQDPAVRAALQKRTEAHGATQGRRRQTHRRRREDPSASAVAASESRPGRQT